MGWDAGTGQWTPDVFRQPLGALGAVTNFGNASRAREISTEIQRNRAAQAAEAEEAVRRRVENADLEAQARAAVQNLGPGASADQIAGTLAQFMPREALPWLRSQASADARVKSAEVAAGGKVDVANINQGMTGAPLPMASAHDKNASGDLKMTQGEDLEATRSARIDLLKATAQLRRDTQLTRRIKAAGVKPSAKEVGVMAERLTRMIAKREALRNRTDPLTGLPKRLTPEDELAIEDMDDAIEEAKSAMEDLKTQGAPTGTKKAPAAKLSAEEEAAAFLSGQ